MAASTTLTPEQRTERARKAAAARTGVDYHINAILAAAPKITDLSDEQVAKLRALFAPIPGTSE